MRCAGAPAPPERALARRAPRRRSTPRRCAERQEVRAAARPADRVADVGARSRRRARAPASASTRPIGSRQLSPAVVADGSKATDGCAGGDRLERRRRGVDDGVEAHVVDDARRPGGRRRPARSRACGGRGATPCDVELPVGALAGATTESARVWSGWPRSVEPHAARMARRGRAWCKRVLASAGAGGYGGGMQIADSVALVTGGASGLGEATVRTLVERGRPRRDPRPPGLARARRWSRRARRRARRSRRPT